MKNLFKILVVVLVVSFVSCTENQEIVTNNGNIIDAEQFGVEKGDTDPEHDKGDDDLEEN
ncbi:hypothetical protein [uncultured Tenacibaculum sp.]|uniref:hypothetical protein n=1 Tax=uncultured Tenacibaculum sp. TaxID=174713 RepID=UPI0026250835|nr:hypothetical protein [uncultured Tenacibaculum sp.]